ncbi:interferon regulatory factor 4 isoform X1 [Esox lucius]|uniref:interferon regulatory factor 4 isoform X1 n=2 Tax=Esox lucius TaxID=8010 RepID=UPI001476B033|nr:interferon regulatory factor 4 isoform X1 [Esox lucius]
MARIRSTRRLRCWMVDQVNINSGRYRGLIWDDDAKTMFRIPWKHAGKQDFRSEEDGAIFKAWAVFKGKLPDGSNADPASWKTRLRCALNKSPEFQEVNERSQMDIPEPYKVYRLVPMSEQALGTVNMKSPAKAGGRKRKCSDSEKMEEEEEVEVKQMKEEIEKIVHIVLQDQVDKPLDILKSERSQDSYHVSVKYLGREVLKCVVIGSDVRIAYQPSLPVPPMPMTDRFPCIQLPEPPSTLTSSPGIGPQLQALSNLLYLMEKGVMLTTSENGVYARRSCVGQIFWTGPHSATVGPHKMNRAVEPEKLFDKEVFRMELDHFRSCGGDPPRCDITLCFGEEFSDTEDPSSKLIITQITLPWAQQQVKEAENTLESMT